MQVQARGSNLRVSPRKMVLVVDLIRGLAVQEARLRLKFSEKKAGGILLKILDSAIANAVHNFKLDAGDLFVEEVFATGGAPLKRVRYVSRAGVAHYHKHTCHVTLKLGVKVPKKVDLLTKDAKTAKKKPQSKEKKK